MIVSELISRYVQTGSDTILSCLRWLLLSVVSRLACEKNLTWTIADGLQILIVLLHYAVEREHGWRPGRVKVTLNVHAFTLLMASWNHF